MLKSQPYYYEDVVFQLELNLQSIRRELIKLLDEFNHDECIICNRLRCRCLDEAPSIDSGRLSDEETFEVRSPPPDALPTPQWTTDLVTSIDNWVKASTDYSYKKTGKFPVSRKVLSKMSLIWPPFGKSVWNERVGKDAIEREKMYKKEGDKNKNSVDLFFGYFKMITNNNDV